MTEGVEQLNQEKIRTPREKKTYKYLGILEADTIKYAEMNEKKENKGRVHQAKKLLETKQHHRNLVKGLFPL